MAVESVFLRLNNESSPKRLRQRTRTTTAPFVFAIVVTIVVSQMRGSNALLSERHIKSPFSSNFERPYSSSISDRLGNGNGIVRAKLSLNASVRSTNKNARRRKQKHARKNQTSEPLPEADRRAKSPGRSLSEEELQSHLNSKINWGNNGPVGPRARTRGMVKRNSDNSGDTTTTMDHISDQQREQQFFLRQLNNRPTLVLNANYMPLGYLPLSLWSWQDAVKAIFKGSVTVVDVYPDLTVRASNIKVPLPSVIALNDYVPQKMTKPAFTRRNVFLRDEYICQYCNNRFHTADLSLDHVVPRSMGGPLSWENAVTCCKKCNCRKGSTPLSEIRHKGMKLNRQPRCPTQMELAALSGRMVPKRVHPTWKPYLGIQERPAAASADASGSEKKGDEEFIDDRYFEQEAE